MPISHFFILLILHFYYLLLPAFSLEKIFPQTGLSGRKAWYPWVNTYLMARAARIYKIWVLLQFLPLIGIFATIHIHLSYLHRMGKQDIWSNILMFLCPWYAFYRLTKVANLRLLTNEELQKIRLSWYNEWINSAIFVLIAVTLFRMFVAEIFVIPTPSMEPTILVNDFVLVNKFSYGMRLPNTPLTLPLTHNVLPGNQDYATRPSYLEWISLPYIRWFASRVKRGDVVVFNFPQNDTFINARGFQSAVTYYELCRQKGRDYVWAHPESFPIATRPVDKRENFVKRCVAVAGDTITIRNSIVYINGIKQDYDEHLEKDYWVFSKKPLSFDFLTDSLEISAHNLQNVNQDPENNNVQLLSLTLKQLNKLTQNPDVDTILLPVINIPNLLYPHNDSLLKQQYGYHWTDINYGPLWVPKKGATIVLNDWNFLVYRRVIQSYEGNSLEKRGEQFYLNGKLSKEYTFKMDYYFMMGDNRGNSLDSRFWGFVPEDHIVGHTWLTIFSKTPETPVFTNLRWQRFPKFIH